MLDLSNQRVGRLTVTDQHKASDKPSGQSRGRLWLCRCDCGAEVWVPSGMLRRTGKGNGTKSCGCLASENGRNFLALYGVPAPLKKEPGAAARRALFSQYGRAAKQRGYDWGLTWEQFCDLIVQRCTYCGTPPSQKFHSKATFNGPVTYNGLDRQDNAGGYTIENTVPCCKTCNYMKRELSVDVFLAHVARIAHHTQESISADHD